MRSGRRAAPGRGPDVQESEVDETEVDEAKSDEATMDPVHPVHPVHRITLSLVSHTNVGKTTLARTLLRRDVGEVLDQAHVTDENTAYPLIAAPDGAELVLWDTPGFGDSVRLLKTLKVHDRPVLWFLRQTWDRLTDRPLYSSQQAALNVRQEADVVLYLVNDSEEPEEAGYIVPELDLLSWMERPIVLLLNQSGEALHDAGRLQERLDGWRRHAERWPMVKEVVSLDAFSRCWVQETYLFERLQEHLPEDRRRLMDDLLEAWRGRNLEIFDGAIEVMASYLGAAAREREALPVRRGLSSGLRKADRKKGMEVLAGRLERSTESLMGELLRLYGLEGKAGSELQTELDAFLVRGELLETEKSALLGGVLSGAAGGLAADLMSGGLTFGGGMVAGAILGALGGAGLASGYRMLSGEKTPAVGWSPPFLDELAEQLLLRYLAVAHFGRGRGAFQQEEAKGRWRDVVSSHLQREASVLQGIWRDAQRSAEDEVLRRLRPVLRRLTADALSTLYPDSKIPSAASRPSWTQAASRAASLTGAASKSGEED